MSFPGEIAAIIKELISRLIDVLKHEKIQGTIKIIKELDNILVKLSEEIDILIRSKEELQKKNQELTQIILGYENNQNRDSIIFEESSRENMRYSKTNPFGYEMQLENHKQRKIEIVKSRDFPRKKIERPKKMSQTNEYIRELQEENLKLKGRLMDSEVSFLKLNAKLDDLLVLAGLD